MKRSKLMRKIVLLLFVISLSGCAFGNKNNYQEGSSFKIHTDNQKIIVAVHDMRPYVQNKDKSANYTGIQRALTGIPYNVTTKSGKPLADDFGSLLVNTMKSNNISAFQREIPYSWSFDEFKRRILGKEKGSRVYYIKMMEWETEKYFRYTLKYDLKVFVFDDQANELANNQQKGSFSFDKDSPGKEDLATATSGIFEKLLAGLELSVSIKDTSANMVQTNELNKTNKQDSKDTKRDTLFKSLPPKIKDEIRKKCAKEYPEDFAMQGDCANKQAAGWLQLNE